MEEGVASILIYSTNFEVHLRVKAEGAEMDYSSQLCKKMVLT